ncbi:MAG: DcaP family trimeric outer membrane transporter [Alphaproteobacteria bacterium]|nr:DcaP family trimeric outer membrane transporter [Alphaproteobacteria bacterium]
MRTRYLLAMPLLSLALATSPALAAEKSEGQDIAALRQQISELMKKVDALEGKVKQQVAAQPTAEEKAAADAAAAKAQGLYLAKGSFPGSILIPGTDTSIKLNGYVKLDVITDLGTSYGGEYNRFAAIPLDGSAKTKINEETRFNARQSRFGIETRSATDMGELKTLIEGDFYGGSVGSRVITNADGFTVRHAYGSLGPVLAGQTWSNFMDVGSLNETMDYGGPSGLIFIRQAQVRYTHDIGNWTLIGSIENPQGDFFSANASSANDVAQNEMPDMVARGDYKHDLGYVSLRGLVRQINVATYTGSSAGLITTSGVSKKDTKYGYAFAVSGKQKIFKGSQDSINFQAAWGDGVGRYFYDLAVPNAGNAYLNGVLETEQAYSGYAGYQHVWSPHWRSNLFGGFTHIMNDQTITSVLDPNQVVNETVASGHLNLVWQPIQSFKVGTEYIHAYRKHQSGAEGNLNRVQTSFMYNF